MLQINEFVKEVGENAIAHRWWDKERSFGELIALCHSELSEALEEFRKGKALNETYYSNPITGRTLKGSNESFCKPEGIPSELADVVIRICDMCHHYDIDLEKILLEKHEFNKTRPYKHGGLML